MLSIFNILTNLFDLFCFSLSETLNSLRCKYGKWKNIHWLFWKHVKKNLIFVQKLSVTSGLECPEIASKVANKGITKDTSFLHVMKRVQEKCLASWTKWVLPNHNLFGFLTQNSLNFWFSSVIKKCFFFYFFFFEI